MPKLSTSFSKKEIESLYKNSKLILREKELDIRVASHSTELPSKLLIIVPKKVGIAVQRNLIKRRIKAIFRENELYLLPYDFMFIARPGILNLSFEQLKNIILASTQVL